MQLTLTKMFGLLCCAASFQIFQSATFAEIPEILIDSEQKQKTYLPDFSYAGYGFGLKELPQAKGKIFDVTKYGAVGDDSLDDSAAILKALDAAHAHNGAAIVYFPRGKFIISELLPIQRSNIVVRGAGRGQNGTTLFFPRPLKMVGDDGKLDELRSYLKKYDKRQRTPALNLDVPFSEYSWSGGFFWIGAPNSRPSPYLEEFDKKPTPQAKSVSGARGALSLKLDNSSSLKKNQWIEIRWYNRDGPEAGIIKALYGNADVKVGSHHWTFANRPLVVQKTKITAINGQTIQIANPLLHDITASTPADIQSWTPLTNIGIEDLTLAFPNAAHFGHHTEQGYNGIYFSGSADSWARNLTITNADSGILTYSSSNLTFRDIRTTGERNAHYAVHIGNAHNVLVDRLQIFNPVLHSLTFNTQSTRNVYKDAIVFSASTLDQHAGANHQNLFDNVTLHINAKKMGNKSVYPIFDGSGAGYWQPGHGGLNTTWNMRVIVEGGADTNETITLQGLDEGPDARIIGISGNRKFDLDYRPKPYVEFINQEITAAPSLYNYQLEKRRKNQN